MRSRSKGQGDLSADEAERALVALRKIRDEECGGSVTKAARELGVSQAALSNIFLGNSSPSYALAVSAAGRLRIPVGVLLAADHTDKMPARARALARLERVLPAEVVRFVRTANVHDEWGEVDWIKFALNRLDDWEMTHGAKTRTTTGVVPVVTSPKRKTR
jgi:transcriptional regulator with XRE-family HTH domain